MKWFWLSALIVLFDQGTKYLATGYLRLYDPVAVLPSFNLTLMHNTGAAFSLLGEAGGWQRWLLSALGVIVSAAIMVWLPRLRLPGWRLPCALALVLGGTLGNLGDRISLGYVIDFIDVYVRHWHWPAFNVADSAITVGAVLLVIDTCISRPSGAQRTSA